MNNDFNYNNGNNMMNNQQPMGNGFQPNGGYPQPQQDQNMMNNMYNQQPMSQPMYNQPPVQPMYNQQPIQNQGFNQPVYTQNNNKSNKIVIFIAAAVIAVGAIVMMLGGSDEMNGSWQCTGSASLKFDFKSGKKFKIHNEGINTNYILGTYTRESATGSNSSYKYYKYYFQATETKDNNGVNKSSISQTYLIGVSSDRKTAVISSTDGYENYLCYKK